VYTLLKTNTEKVAASAAYKEKLGNLGVVPNTDFSEPFADFQAKELSKWARAVRDSGATLD